MSGIWCLVPCIYISNLLYARQVIVSYKVFLLYVRQVIVGMSLYLLDLRQVFLIHVMLARPLAGFGSASSITRLLPQRLIL